MENYWFLYNINDGSFYSAPYKGNATEWKNIPEGCNVLGFIGDEVTEDVISAFNNHYNYKVENNKLVYIEYTPPIIITEPTEQEKQTELLNQMIIDNLNMQMQIDTLISNTL